MTEQELRAWSLSIVAILNNYEHNQLEYLLDSENKRFINEIQEYIKSGIIPSNSMPDGLHKRQHRFKNEEN